jgi:spore coat protein H
MNPRPASARTQWAVTAVAFLFAVGSVVWSVASIRHWLGEQRASSRAERGGRWDREPEAEEAPPVPTKALAAFAARQSTASLTNAAALFRTTNVWTIHLKFTPDQWEKIEPRQIEPLEQRWGPNGEFMLRNPEAKRNGLAGVRGIEFDWVRADVEFEDRVFPGSAVRYKGNGTYLRSQRLLKRPFKVDLNKFTKHHELAGRTTLNLANLVTDDSCLHDVLAYELYRAAGVPAPRTAFARLFLSTNTQPARHLGVYALIENIDQDFVEERLGTRAGAIFKPVTPHLFSDLGDDWPAYDGIYDPKNKLTEAQSRRVIEFARLLTHADAATFAARVGEFIELDEFARFLAVTVLLSSYDGFLTNGQNFYLWLSPDTQRFQFLPWDLDNAWGRFGMVGSATDRAEASIMHPWLGNHRLLERIMVVPEFERRYRSTLDELLRDVFVPAKLHRRVDELAALLRPLIAEESARKLARFEQAVTRTRLESAEDDGRGFGRNRPPHPLKWFITERARSVRAQLDGTSEGVQLERWR